MGIKTMKKVFILWHHYPDDLEDGNAKLLGVYSSREIAEKRRDEKYRHLPGLARGEGKFSIDQYEIDQDHWNEGFLRTDEK